jgi:hypothetical protein
MLARREATTTSITTTGKVPHVLCLNARALLGEIDTKKGLYTTQVTGDVFSPNRGTA